MPVSLSYISDKRSFPTVWRSILTDWTGAKFVKAVLVEVKCFFENKLVTPLFSDSVFIVVHLAWVGLISYLFVTFHYAISMRTSAKFWVVLATHHSRSHSLAYLTFKVGVSDLANVFWRNTWAKLDAHVCRSSDLIDVGEAECTHRMDKSKVILVRVNWSYLSEIPFVALTFSAMWLGSWKLFLVGACVALVNIVSGLTNGDLLNRCWLRQTHPVHWDRAVGAIGHLVKKHHVLGGWNFFVVGGESLLVWKIDDLVWKMANFCVCWLFGNSLEVRLTAP